jgi:trk system potassium uptake protein TrkH
MNWTVVQRILGLLLMVFSITMLPPILVSIWYADQAWLSFIEGFALTLVAGIVCWLPVRRERRELRLRDGFLVVASFWTVLGTFGAAPLYFDDSLSLTVTDAIFESISGLTTTGATVLTGLYYRQQLQWLGGMGIIVLAVAVLPMLGVGGMQLYRAETPGPVKDTKLTPRITETAKALWYVYLGFTISCLAGYMLSTPCATPSPRSPSAVSPHTISASAISTAMRSVSSRSFSCSSPASTFRCIFSRGGTFPSSTTRRIPSAVPTRSY